MSDESISPAVIIYTRPMCSGCDEVKEYLAVRGIPYTEKDIKADIATMIEFRRKGYDVLPVIEIGDHAINEYETLDQLTTLLQETGYARS